MKKIRLLCTMLLLCILCGCYGRDIKDVAIVMGIGIDSGEDASLKTTTQIVIPKGLAREGGGDTFENFEGEGKHLAECMENTALKCGKYMYLSHATAILIGEDMARNGINESLDYFIRDNQLRSNITVAVAKGSITEIMEKESELMQVPLSGVASLGRKFRETSLGNAPRVFDVVADMMKKDCATLVPIVSADGIYGSAIFKDGKMVGEISNAEARGVLWLCDKVENTIITVESGDLSLDIKVNNSECKINPVYNGNFYVDANVKCNVSILRDNSGVFNIYGHEIIKQKINEKIKSEIITSFEKVHGMGADVYGFADKFYKKYKILNEDVFLNIKINLNVDCEIEDTGSTVKSAERKKL